MKLRTHILRPCADRRTGRVCYIFFLFFFCFSPGLSEVSAHFGKAALGFLGPQIFTDLFGENGAKTLTPLDQSLACEVPTACSVVSNKKKTVDTAAAATSPERVFGRRK